MRGMQSEDPWGRESPMKMSCGKDLPPWTRVPRPSDDKPAPQEAEVTKQVRETSKHFPLPEGVRSREGPRECAENTNRQVVTDCMSLLARDTRGQDTADRISEWEACRRW